jgi:hypothetical protein
MNCQYLLKKLINEQNIVFFYKFLSINFLIYLLLYRFIKYLC